MEILTKLVWYIKEVKRVKIPCNFQNSIEKKVIIKKKRKIRSKILRKINF